MLQQNPYQQYQQTAVETASSERLIIMLYDGAIKNVNLAKAGLNEGNIEEGNRYILKTQDFINELIVSLNMDAGEIAQNLYNLYDYFRRRLIEANTKKDVTILDELLAYLTELRGAWSEAVVKTKSTSVVQEHLNVER